MNEDRIEGRAEDDTARQRDAALPLQTDRTRSTASASTASAPLSEADVAAIIEKNYVGLRLLVVRRCRDQHVGADLLNEAICTTWAKWQAGKIARPEQIAGYVLQVTMNLLRNHRRAIGERPEKRADAARLQELPGDAEPGDETMEREIALQVKNVIRGMSSQRDRAILVRFYLDEEDKETICHDMGLNPLQFDKVLHRARGRLRKLLEAGGLGRADLLSLCAFL
jgi:RNA polymerase sigma-70 factor (ECF subfamily)